MANGDAAAAAGMAVVPGTADRRNGYDEINLTRDYIAQRTSTVTPITKGGTGATTAAAARTALDVPSNATLTSGLAGKQASGNYAGRLYAGGIAFNWSSGLKVQVDATTMDIPTTNAPGDFVRPSNPQGFVRQGTSFDAQGGYIASMGSRNSTVTSNYAACYMDGATGLFGVPGSSRAMKKDLTEWTPEDAARLLDLLKPYWGHYNGDEPDAPLRPFFILEEFEDAGFSEFVIYGTPQAVDEMGNPKVDEIGNPVWDKEAAPVGKGIHYELVSVALLAIAQLQEARLIDIESRLAALEG